MEDEASAELALPRKPFSPQINGLKKCGMKRNLSVPKLEALDHVEHSILMDDAALRQALSMAGGHAL